MYTQHRPGVYGGHTAGLEPEQSEDEYSAPGPDRRWATGHPAAGTIGELAKRYGRDVADICNRQNIQLPWVRIEDVPAIWEGLDSVGLSTTEACGDTPRNMLGCPLASVAEDEIIDGSPALDSLAPFIGDPEFSNLPRKYKIAVSGCAQHCTIHEIDDVAFVGVLGPDATLGFDLWVGGGCPPIRCSGSDSAPLSARIGSRSCGR